MTEATQTIDHSVTVKSIRSLAPGAYFDDYQKHFVKAIATLGREGENRKTEKVPRPSKISSLTTVEEIMQLYSLMDPCKEGLSMDWHFLFR